MNPQKLLLVFGLTLLAGVFFRFGVLRWLKPEWRGSKLAQTVASSLVMALVAFSVSFAYNPQPYVYAHEQEASDAWYASPHARE